MKHIEEASHIAPAPETASRYDGKAGTVAALYAQSIAWFMEITKVPRPSFHLDKIRAYLRRWAERHDFLCFHDMFGNIWMDVPATKGFENYPKVILQAHMDMVCTGKQENTVDFENTPVRAIVSENTIKAENTSLGADNGIGMAIALALATGEEDHGPMRILITADEEVGMLGAAGLDASVLDADYLINMDEGELGKITYSSAGGMEALFHKTLPTKACRAEEKIYTLSVKDLLGGHSGARITENRINAIDALIHILNKLEDESGEIKLIKSMCGTASNAIPSYGTVTLAMPADFEASASALVKAEMETLKMEHAKENFSYTFSEEDVRDHACISVSDTKEMLRLLGGLPKGVIRMSQKEENLPETSSNTGIWSLKNGKTEVRVMPRSCITSELDDFETMFANRSKEAGYGLEIIGKYPGWDGSKDAPLLKLAKVSFEKSGVTPVLAAIHAGLESSYLAALKPGMQIMCIGPTINGAHSTDETLHTDTVKPTISALTDILASLHTL